PGAARFSRDAKLTVVRDLIPPSVTQVFNFGDHTIQLLFSKPVETQTATSLTNYALSNGLPITGAELDSASLTVTLTTPPLRYATSPTLTPNRTTDTPCTPNTSSSTAVVNFSLTQPVAQDLGNPAIASVTTVLSNAVKIVAAGKDIGGTSDQFNFNYQRCSGDF